MSLSKSKRDRLISDFLFGIENPEYEVKQKNDGGWLVRRRRKKSLFSKNPKIEKPKEEKEEAPPEKPKRSFDDISLDEIAEKLLEKINTLRKKKEKEEEEKEEEDVDEKLIHGIEEEKNEPIHQEREPISPPTDYDEPPPQYFRRRSVRLY